MKKQDYTATISVNTAPEGAFKKIAKVNGWWAKNFDGKAEKLNDTFTVRFGETFVDFKVTESVPAKKLVWYVTNCNLHWIKAKKEWKDTEVVFELFKKGNSTQIDFTHVGLAPGDECYETCEAGWNGHIKGSLVNFINGGKGMPQ